MDEKADKITVSYDELNTRKVDQRLKEQDALARNRVYASMDETVAASQAGGDRGLGNLWRNSIFALTVFGFIGGLLAWGCGALLAFSADTERDTADRIGHVDRLVEMYTVKGRPLEDVRRWLDDSIAEGQAANPHFALAVIRKDADFRRQYIEAQDVNEQAVRARLKELNSEMATLPPPSSRGSDTRRLNLEGQIAEQERELKNITERRTRAVADARAQNPDFAVMYDPNLKNEEKIAKLNQLSAAREDDMTQILARERVRSFVANLLAYGVRGLIIGCLLAIAVPLTENNVSATIINGSVGAALGLAGGVAATFVTRAIESTSSGAAPDSLAKFLTTVAVWGSLGIFLTLAPGVVMRNFKKLSIGLLGGLIGGLLGGVAFEPIQNMGSEPQPRLAELVAMVLIGTFAGLATGLIEDAAKTGWLKVVQGLIAGKQFILYRNPTFIGAGPDCQIYLFKDPKVGKRHAAIHIVPGGFELEDLPLGSETLLNGKATKRTRLKNGDRIQIGGTQLVFMEKAQATA